MGTNADREEPFRRPSAARDYGTFPVADLEDREFQRTRARSAALENALHRPHPTPYQPLSKDQREHRQGVSRGIPWAAIGRMWPGIFQVVALVGLSLDCMLYMARFRRQFERTEGQEDSLKAFCAFSKDPLSCVSERDASCRRCCRFRARAVRCSSRASSSTASRRSPCRSESATHTQRPVSSNDRRN